MRAPLIVKRTTSITGKLWAAFTDEQVASRLAEIANFSRTQPEAISQSGVEMLRRSSDVRCWGLNRPESAAPEGRLLTLNGLRAAPV